MWRAPGGAPDDFRGPRSRPHGHGGLHDRELTGHHGCRAFHSAGGYRRSGRCRAPCRRPFYRGEHRRRTSDASNRTGSGRQAAMTARFALVALPLPLATPYTYRIPEALGDRVALGARVVVPVRRRELIGVVVGLESEAPSQQLKEILAVPDPDPALPPALLATAEWIAGYYGAPLGLTLKSVLPAGMWGESQVIVSLRNGSHSFGGLAGEVVAWLEQRGGESPVQTAARAFRRPLWEVVERLSRVQAVTLRGQPPDTDAAR